MKKQAANQPERCLHRTKCGRRCRRPAAGPESRFCERHEGIDDADHKPDLSLALTAGLQKLDSPAALSEFLSRLLLLLSQDRISPRRAAVLAYVTNQILRAVSAVERQATKNEEGTHIEYVIGIPRPQHMKKLAKPRARDRSTQTAKRLSGPGLVVG
jgi:hypothetical protein